MGKYLSLDRDITFLEIILIALSIFLWQNPIIGNKGIAINALHKVFQH
jgi:hypothetical protein